MIGKTRIEWRRGWRWGKDGKESWIQNREERGVKIVNEHLVNNKNNK